MSRRILTCRVKIATQEPMHMSASPWIIVRKGKNAVRVSYPAYTESLNNAQDMRGRGCSSSDPHSWSSGLGRGEYLVEKQTNKQINFVILIIACRAGVSKDRTSEETRQPPRWESVFDSPQVCLFMFQRPWWQRSHWRSHCKIHLHCMQATLIGVWPP